MVADLEDAPFFCGIGTEGREALCALATAESAAPETQLFELGTEATKLYVVKTGRVTLSLPIEVNNERHDANVEDIEQGQLFGWSALVKPYRYTMSARAVAESELLSWSGSRLREFFQSEPPLGVRFLENLTQLIGHRLLHTQAMWLRELQRTIASQLR